MQAGSSETGAAGRRWMTAMALAGAWLCTTAPASAGVNRWTSVGPAGGFFDLAAAPGAPGTVYALSGDGGVSRSGDGGQTWEIQGAIPVPAYNTDLIAVDPSDSATLFAAVRFTGVFKSADGGVSWRQALAGDAFRVVVAPSAPQVVYAMVVGSGLRRSADGGATWGPVEPGPEFFDDVEVDPADANTLYALGSGGLGLLKTSDGGATWIPQSLPFQLVRLPIVDAHRPATWYAFGSSQTQNATEIRLWRSLDGGATWTAGALQPAGSLRETALSPSGVLYATFTAPNGGVPTAIDRTVDGGVTWQLASSIPTTSVALAADAGSPDRLYLAAIPDGVLVSEDQAQTWTTPARGPSGRNVYQLLAGRGAAGGIYITATPTSFESIPADFFHSADGGATWSSLAPIWPVLVEPLLVLDANPGIFYTASALAGQGLDYISPDGGGTWQPLAPTNPSSQDGLDLAADPLHSGKLLKLDGIEGNCGTPAMPQLCTLYSLYRSNTAGHNWRVVTRLRVIPPVNFPGVFPGKLRLDPLHPTTVYLLAVKLYRSTAASPAFAALPLPGPVLDLAIDPHAPVNLYAAVGRRQPFFKSTDGGASWKSASIGLPPGAVVHALAIDPAAPATLYLATDHGVFVTDDAARSWEPLDDGLPEIAVTGLAVPVGLPRSVYASTTGAGVFGLTRP